MDNAACVEIRKGFTDFQSPITGFWARMQRLTVYPFHLNALAKAGKFYEIVIFCHVWVT